jgi:Zn-dependent protease with chaperone function
MNKLFFVSTVTLALMLSFVFCIVLVIMLYFKAINLTSAIGFSVVINVLLWLIGPWITDLMQKWFYQTTFYKEDEVKQQYPAVYEIIKKITDEKKFKFPKFGVIADDNPTAFSYGSARYNARVVVTHGIFKYLNDGEVEAVLAHEMGHIVNRDFIVMMVASTLVQILYEIYAVLIRAKGKNTTTLKIIALASYVLYWVSTYLLYYLSRTRESLADEFSARRTSPQDLSNALIKIAYGIVSAADDAKTTRLLHSTRHMGIVDVKNAKHIGVTSYITHNDPEVLAEVMVFDRVSWWARWVELSSTHPLTGKRIQRLSNLSKELGKAFSYDIDGAIARMKLDYGRLRNDFMIGAFVSILPVVLFFVFLFATNIVWAAVGLCLGFAIMYVYKFPHEKAVETTVLEEMRNPYASPMKGKVVILDGKVIGRGVPGYVFSEDMMYQDKTGLIFLDYNSVFWAIGDFFFSIGKIKKLYNVSSTAEGWYFRSMGSMVALRSIKTDKDFVRSHPILWSLVSRIGGTLILLVLFLSFFHNL